MYVLITIRSNQCHIQIIYGLWKYKFHHFCYNRVTHKNKSMRYGKAQNLMNAILQRGSNHGEIKHRKLEIPKQVKFEHIDVSKFSKRKLFEANSVSKETANNLNDLIKHDILLA